MQTILVDRKVMDGLHIDVMFAPELSSNYLPHCAHSICKCIRTVGILNGLIPTIWGFLVSNGGHEVNEFQLHLIGLTMKLFLLRNFIRASVACVTHLKGFTSTNVVVRPSQTERLEYFENGLTLNHQIIYRHTYRPTLQLHRK